jgi:hypothetical protein
MRTVSSREVASDEQFVEGLPERMQEALGELAGAAKEGLLALSVGVGLGVLHEVMEAEVCEVVGPKGKHNPERAAVRHGHEDGSVTLGGRRVAVSRPRVRSGDDERELPLGTYRHFADRDPLTEAVLERILAGELERSHPGAAASLREGLEETLTIARLGVRGALKKTLQSANPCESMIECVRRTSRNVKRWQNGDMCLRWTAAGMLEAERQFRRVIGYPKTARPGRRRRA